jgi:hypothetical protein
MPAPSSILLRARPFLLCAIILGALAPAVSALQPPQPPRNNRNQQPETPPRPQVFDPNLNAVSAIDAAIARARPLQKNVLIIWGEESQTRPTDMLYYILNYADMPIDLHYEYELVKVEIGEGPNAEANLALAKSMKVPVRDKGEVRHAVMTAIDLDKKVLANKPFDETVITRSGENVYDIHTIKPFLNSHKPTLISADAILAKALEEAKSSHKGVMLRFHEPWCIWCKRLDAVLARPEVNAAMSSAYILADVDTARNPSGMALLTRVGNKFVEGLPYYVFLDENGEVVSRSQPEPPAAPDADKPSPDNPGKTTRKREGPPPNAPHNIGFPTTDSEIAAFEQLLKTSKPPLAAPQIKVVIDALRAERANIQREQSATPPPSAPAAPK